MPRMITWSAIVYSKVLGGNIFKLIQLANNVIQDTGTAIQFVLSRGGGVRSVIRKAWVIFKLEGWAGIWLRFVYVHRNNYTKWIRHFDSLDKAKIARMQQKCTEFPMQPLIAVILANHDIAKLEWLSAAIESVRGQVYPNWQLRVVMKSQMDNRDIIAMLEQVASQDSRITLVKDNQELHESIHTADWVMHIDDTGLLSSQALFWFVTAINQNPDAGLLYADEDKIDKNFVRILPQFKCSWNVDLFYSFNMIGNPYLLRRELLESLSDYLGDFSEVAVYDFLLRYIELVDERQIIHIPRVLYHSRNQELSTDSNCSEQEYYAVLDEQTLSLHLQRQSINACAQLDAHGHYRLRHELPMHLPLVSLIIPTRNGLELLKQCIDSILHKTDYKNYEILIIDNGSDDPDTLTYFQAFSGHAVVRVIRDDRPFNFSALNNAAVKQAKGELVALINNDIEVISVDWLSEMVSHALRPDVGAVGAKLWFPNDSLQHGGVILGLGLGNVAGHFHCFLPKNVSGYYGRDNAIQSLSAVTAACLVIKKSIYEQVGGLNETDLQVAFNDVDFCLRVRAAGYKNIWTPYAELYHHESASRGVDDTPEKQSRYAREVSYMKQHWGDLLQADPAYSPNLSLTYADFSLAWPPRIPNYLSIP